ncbi:fumarylacetoacetate hydrolase family protein [Microvirga sp. W0021]|uniref:Fumarylacetoacetate hydrolase family protein n=1 Tax=Hohaiivirga grylli TaxID=3133970 RepID=A0ABV0BLA4_9HYPH
MFFAIPAPIMPTISIAVSNDLFPVHRIYCVGRNYAAHAKEMGHNPDKEPPFFFMKQADTVLSVPDVEQAELPYPSMTEDYHHEVELVAALGIGGKDIPENEALQHVFGYAIGLDMTRRDRQQEAKKNNHPWEIAKSADHSAPIGPLHLVGDVGHLHEGSISLSIDGVEKQKGNLNDMIWSVAQQISYLSRYFELKPGDLIFSGTPEGVGPVKRGQSLSASIEKLGTINLKVV